MGNEYKIIVALLVFSSVLNLFIKELIKSKSDQNSNKPDSTELPVYTSRKVSVFYPKNDWGKIAKELWKNEEYETLKKRLPGALEFYNAEAYYYYGKLLLRDGNVIKAGCYFLFSGLWGQDEQSAVLDYIDHLKKMSPQQSFSTVPAICKRRRSRMLFPECVFDDLTLLPFPEWFKKRPKTLG